MLLKILLVTAAVVCGRAAEFHSDTSRSSGNYATSSPSPYTPEPSYHSHSGSAESRGYKEDDRRSYNDGPSHARTGPPKKLGPVPGPGALPFGGPAVPLAYPQRYLPPGSIIGYLAYPQPLVHGAYPALHEPSVLPSAGFGHIALASPLTLSHYGRPLQAAGPSYSAAGPTYNPYSQGPGSHSTYNSGHHPQSHSSFK